MSNFTLNPEDRLLILRQLEGARMLEFRAKKIANKNYWKNLADFLEKMLNE